MTGQRIKEILAAEGISLAELSRLLGYEGDQRLHNALRSDNVKSGLLEDIDSVKKKRVCFFYPNDNGGVANASDSSVAVLGSQNQITTISERFLGLLEKKDEQIDRLLSLMESQKGGK